jgi:hypothetical protein
MDNIKKSFQLTFVVDNVKWQFSAKAGDALISMVNVDATTNEHLYSGELPRNRVKDVITDLLYDL